MKKEIEYFLELLKKKPEVVAILLLGGMGKQKNIHPIDEYSDIDIAIIIECSELPDWLPNFSFFLWYENQITNTLVNVYQCTLSSLKENNVIWGMSKCEAYQHAQVYYDKSGTVSVLIKEIIERSNKKKQVLIENIHIIDRFIHKNPTKMIFRGYYISANIMINEALKRFIESLYLINDVFVPHFKWQENDLKYLEWIPSNCINKLREIIVIKDFSKEEIYRRASIFDELYKELVLKYDSLFEEEIYRVVCSKINTDRQLLCETAADLFLKENIVEDEKNIRSYINSNLMTKDNLKKLSETTIKEVL